MACFVSFSFHIYLGRKAWYTQGPLQVLRFSQALTPPRNLRDSSVLSKTSFSSPFSNITLRSPHLCLTQGHSSSLQVSVITNISPRLSNTTYPCPAKCLAQFTATGSHDHTMQLSGRQGLSNSLHALNAH